MSLSLFLLFFYAQKEFFRMSNSIYSDMIMMPVEIDIDVNQHINIVQNFLLVMTGLFFIDQSISRSIEDSIRLMSFFSLFH